MKEEIIGTTGKLVDLFNENLTQEEWKALCVVHRLGARLSVGIRFDWSKSIDVRGVDCSQIIDESVFLDREHNTNSPHHNAKLPVSRSALKSGYTAVLRILHVLENVYGDAPIEDDKLLIEKLQKFIKGVEGHFC